MADLFFGNVIDGDSRPSRDGDTLEVIDPSTRAVYATAARSGPADIDDACAAAARAFASWRRTIALP